MSRGIGEIMAHAAGWIDGVALVETDGRDLAGTLRPVPGPDDPGWVSAGVVIKSAAESSWGLAIAELVGRFRAFVERAEEEHGPLEFRPLPGIDHAPVEYRHVRIDGRPARLIAGYAMEHQGWYVSLDAWHEEPDPAAGEGSDVPADGCTCRPGPPPAGGLFVIAEDAGGVGEEVWAAIEQLRPVRILTIGAPLEAGARFEGLRIDATPDRQAGGTPPGPSDGPPVLRRECPICSSTLYILATELVGNRAVDPAIAAELEQLKAQLVEAERTIAADRILRGNLQRANNELVETIRGLEKQVEENDPKRGRPGFAFGEKVFHAIQPWDDRDRGMVTGIHLWPGLIAYDVVWANNRTESRHYEIELVPADEETD